MTTLRQLIFQYMNQGLRLRQTQDNTMFNTSNDAISDIENETFSGEGFSVKGADILDRRASGHGGVLHVKLESVTWVYLPYKVI